MSIQVPDEPGKQRSGRARPPARPASISCLRCDADHAASGPFLKAGFAARNCIRREDSDGLPASSMSRGHGRLQVSGSFTGWILFLGPFFGGPLFFWFGQGAQELETVTRIVVAGRARIVVAVAKRISVVAFGLLCCPRVSKVCTVTGIGEEGGSWSRNSELSSLLVSSVVLESQNGSTFVFAIVCLCFVFFRGRSLEFEL